MKISPDGTQILFLSNGDDWRMDLSDDVTVARATHVRYDNEKGVWKVILRITDHRGLIHEIEMTRTFGRRSEALAYEIEICEMFLAGDFQIANNVIEAQQRGGHDSG